MLACLNSARRGGAALAAIACLGASAAAIAAEPPAPAAPDVPELALPIADAVPARWLQVKPRPVIAIGAPVDVARLAAMRGGEDDQHGIVVIDGSVDGNSAERVTSGSNHLGSDAFGNANGINTVIQNTGSNVLIQNAMVVNVRFAEAAP